MRAATYSFDVRRGEVDQNLAVVERGLREAREAGCDLVVLPEMWTTSFADFGSGTDSGTWVAESERALDRVTELSGELGLVVAGTTPAASGGPLPFNRLTIHSRGERVLQYDKVHLFSPAAEELNFSAGDAPPAIVASERTGLPPLSGSVCYDLRFGEVLRGAVDAGAEVLVVPAQWASPRATQWRSLAIGRAVEYQCFVVGCNRMGREVVGRRELELDFPGNSLIVDPYGVVLAEGDASTPLLVADLDLEVLRKLRIRVPVAKDRRVDLYEDW